MIYEARSCFVPSRHRHQWLARLSPLGILSAVVVALLLFAGEVSAATNFPGYEVTINKSECSEANSGKYVNIWTTKGCLRKCNDSDDCVAFVYQPKRRHCKVYAQCTLKANPEPVTKTLLYTKEGQSAESNTKVEPWQPPGWVEPLPGAPMYREFKLIPSTECFEANSGKFFWAGGWDLEECAAMCRSPCSAFILEPESKTCKIYEECTHKKYPYNPDPATRTWLYDSKSTAGIQSISPCWEEINSRWELFQNSMCDGQEHFTLRKGETIVHEADPYDDDTGGIEDSQKYDGTLSMCQEVFVMDYWRRLQNEDIRVGRDRRDSWLTWDPKDGSCMLYYSTEDCQQLRRGAETEGMVSAHYCNFNS